MMLTLSDLEDLVGHVAGEANHAKNVRTENILSDIFDKIEDCSTCTSKRGRPAGSSQPKASGKLLKIRPFDPEWTLPSRMDDNPLIWMLEVNGLITDIRLCLREAQVVAFEKRLIPTSPPTGLTIPTRSDPWPTRRVDQSHHASSRGTTCESGMGVRDPDFPDIPLGGWAGTIKEVHQAEGETTLLVAWDRATLRGMHPIYKKRCERDGLELESMWLGDEDLEPDDDALSPSSSRRPSSRSRCRRRTRTIGSAWPWG